MEYSTPEGDRKRYKCWESISSRQPSKWPKSKLSQLSNYFSTLISVIQWSWQTRIWLFLWFEKEKNDQCAHLVDLIAKRFLLRLKRGGCEIVFVTHQSIKLKTSDSSSPSHITKQIGCAGILFTGMVAAAASRIVCRLCVLRGRNDTPCLCLTLSCMNLQDHYKNIFILEY